MIIKQISVFLENRPGTLSEVLEILGVHGINIRAMAVADTNDFGILRLIVNDPDHVEKVLRDANYAVKVTPVLAMKIIDHPGGLLEELQKLTSCGINIEYVYAFATSSPDGARVVLKVDDLEKANKIVSKDNEAAKDCNFFW